MNEPLKEKAVPGLVTVRGAMLAKVGGIVTTVPFTPAVFSRVPAVPTPPGPVGAGGRGATPVPGGAVSIPDDGPFVGEDAGTGPVPGGGAVPFVRGKMGPELGVDM